MKVTWLLGIIVVSLWDFGLSAPAPIILQVGRKLDGNFAGDQGQKQNLQDLRDKLLKLEASMLYKISGRSTLKNIRIIPSLPG